MPGMDQFDEMMLALQGITVLEKPRVPREVNYLPNYLLFSKAT
jgi:hypothetical protein